MNADNSVPALITVRSLSELVIWYKLYLVHEKSRENP